MLSPIALNSGLLTCKQNQTIEPETSRMQNPFRTPMLIDEIRFASDYLTNAGLMGAQIFVRAEIWYGRTQLTRGFVPVGGLGPVIQTTLRTPGTYFTFRPPRPIYVEPEDLLVTKVKFDPTGFTLVGSVSSLPDSIPVYVTYVGRSLSADVPKPQKITLPWVSHFTMPFLTVTNGANDSTLSTPAQLLNPFDQPMRVSHFIGRTLMYGSTIGEDDDQLFSAPQEASGNWAIPVVWDGTYVRASDSFGNILVRDPTPFGHLFQYPTRTWQVNSMLSPKAYYLMQVDRNYVITVPAASDPIVRIAHSVSMVGSREVDL